MAEAVTGPLALRNPATRDPAAVGAKAALLAIAADEGLPVLPGLVLPADASAPAIAAGADALSSRGRPPAYIAASSVEPASTALDALAAVGERLVVRSSTPFDVDGRWSGAFASYLDVGSNDLASAVRGCWSSAFTRDALERCEAMETDPTSLRVGVLVQPWVAFTFGGTAHVDGERDEVRVSVARGSAHCVVAGRAASTVTVAADGSISGDADVPLVGVAQAAALARDALRATGVGAIEWGATGERLVLLQVGPAAAESHSRRTATVVPAVPFPADAARVAEIVARFRGALADDLVLPWALGARSVFHAPPIVVDDVRPAISAVRRLAAELLVAVWGAARHDTAAAAISHLRRGEAERGLAMLRGIGRPDPAAARQVVGLIGGVGQALEVRGVLPAAETVWQLTFAELDAAARGIPPVTHAGPDRWEPFLAEAAFALGERRDGTPVAGGVGAGGLHVVSTLRQIGRPSPRAILAAPAPLPQLAPLLWHCAGFITPQGSAGAHLFEVARSLGVPALIGVAPDDLGPPRSLVAVDGSTGIVASLGRPANGHVRSSA